MRRAVRPGGRLVLLFNTSRAVAGEFARESRAEYANWVIDELARLDVALPDAETAVRARLTAHARRRELREGAFAGPEEVESLLSSAGFRIESCIAIDVAVTSPVDAFHAKISKRRYMAVAEPMAAP
jgi:hypothetical protein